MRILLFASMLATLLTVAAIGEPQQQSPERTVSVVGEVQHPGVYSFKGEQTLTLSQAIAMATGFTARADKKHVEITRMGSEKMTFDLGAMLRAATPDVPLKDGDVIWVPQLGKRPVNVPKDCAQCEQINGGAKSAFLQ
jgi:protein involved in polysaccharide export with SLBB domain